VHKANVCSGEVTLCVCVCVCVGGGVVVER